MPRVMGLSHYNLARVWGRKEHPGPIHFSPAITIWPLSPLVFFYLGKSIYISIRIRLSSDYGGDRGLGRRVSSVSLSDEEDDFLKFLEITPGEYLKLKIAEDRQDFEPKEMIQKKIEMLDDSLRRERRKLEAYEQKKLDFFEKGRPQHILDELYGGYKGLVERMEGLVKGGKEKAISKARGIVMDGWRDQDRKVVKMSRSDLAVYLEGRLFKERQEELVRIEP